jgi:hypothetical protein
VRVYHDSPCRGHFVDKRTAYKVLHQGYYWPTLFKDARKYVRSCDSCQRMGKLVQEDEMPLQTQVLVKLFERWALDFVGANLSFITKKRYILVCTNYVTKWVEEKSLCSASKESVIDFIYEDIFTHFGIPKEIVTR